MNKKVKDLLQGKGGNYIFPFFWQHGESEEVLRNYMKVIHDCGIGAVCVESRPHPDFCGEKWWKDMDVILDEARKRDMRVWILDDSHFPTGFANGAMENKPDEMCRQSICCRTIEVSEGGKIQLSEEELNHPKPFEPSMIEQYVLGEQRKFSDDRLIGVIARRQDCEKWIDLTNAIEHGKLLWTAPEGTWKVILLHLSRNYGYHRSYINMMDRESCKVLLDAVYEPHYAHYAADFGKTIAGFFSDEPELGNGHLYEYKDDFGSDNDYPWSKELEERLKKIWGEELAAKLSLLWDVGGDAQETAEARYQYMDNVTRMVQKNFSEQIGSWCHAHGVKYIGHLIEDDNHHSRTGSSLGHYFRGLFGQHMAGIDDIGGQVFPQGEDICYDKGLFEHRNGSFYHYLLGKLASSAAAVEPWKNGDSMCEIFGNYGWEEGVRLEKYLVDHFMVRGINHFVPHAFSPKEFPDPDCPPHFYAHGNNPQYRHFGELMRYTNRVCNLLSNGHHTVSAAVLYHGENDWMSGTMTADQIGHVLYDCQLDYDVIPQDVFGDKDTFHTTIEQGHFQVNTQVYPALIVPGCRYITQNMAETICEMAEKGIPVYFVGERPSQICDSKAIELPQKFSESGCVVQIDELPNKLEKFREVTLYPKSNRIRCIRYVHPDGMTIYFMTNEGTKEYQGSVSFLRDKNFVGKLYEYDAWENQVYAADTDNLNLEPMKNRIFVLDNAAENICPEQKTDNNQKEIRSFTGKWKRSICRSINYPRFEKDKVIVLPDDLAKEEPEFSGFVRYENTFKGKEGDSYLLDITDAYEGVEVFLNGKSLGIQIVPVFRYLLKEGIVDGENHICIEVATTLSREMAKYPNSYGQIQESTASSGITGEVLLYKLV